MHMIVGVNLIVYDEDSRTFSFLFARFLEQGQAALT